MANVEAITVATMSHPGPDWSGGCHSYQAFNNEAEVIETYCEQLNRQNWNAHDVRSAIEQSRANGSGLRSESATVESDDGDPCTIYLEITVTYASI